MRLTTLILVGLALGFVRPGQASPYATASAPFTRASVADPTASRPHAARAKSHAAVASSAPTVSVGAAGEAPAVSGQTSPGSVKSHALAASPGSGTAHSAAKANLLDTDVLAASLAFSAYDMRFQEISPHSYFGHQLAVVRAKIAAEGMTADNKAALISVYHDATKALQDILANEKQP